MDEEHASSGGAYVLEVLDEAGVVVWEERLSQYVRIGRRSEELTPEVVIPDECTSTSRDAGSMRYSIFAEAGRC